MSKRNIFISTFVTVGFLTSLGYASIAQSPAPTTSPEVTPSPTVSPIPEVAPTPTASPDVTPVPTPTTSPGVTPIPTTSPEVTPTPTTSPEVSPSPSPTNGTNRSSLSPADREFMVKAAQGGMAEVQFAQIATKRASSSAVKQYAQRMIQEHTKANNELMALAKAKGVTLPKSIGAKNRELKKRLSTLSGTRFDRQYMREAGVKGHEEQARLFERQVQGGQNPDVKAFARKTLPVVQMHLQEAERVTGARASRTKIR